jgi:hypothetical protein
MRTLTTLDRALGILVVTSNNIGSLDLRDDARRGLPT